MDPICLSVPKVTVFICIGDVTEIRIVLMVLMRRIAVSYYRSRKGFFLFKQKVFRGNCNGNFHLGRYIVGFTETVTNFILG